MHVTTRRLIIVSLIWLLLTGKTVIRCSSGDDDFNSLPPDEDNRPPVAADAFYQISGVGPLTAFMRATDPDGDSLRYRVVSGPGLGSLRDLEASSGRFTYLPGGAGSDSFSFRASDGRRDSNIAVVSIRITSAGQAASVKTTAAAVLPPLNGIAQDPADPDALWLQWALPAGGIQRLGQHGALGPLVPEAAAAGGSMLQNVWTAGVKRETKSLSAASSPEGYALAQATGAFGVRGRLLVTTRRSDTQIWHSHDGGESWQMLAGDLPGPASAASLLQDAVRPLQWQLLLELGGVSQLLLSRDGGLSWRRRLSLPWPGLKPMRCGTDMLCLIDASGSHLWRLPLEP